MQALQLLKLSISAVVIPMCALDRQEMRCMEYQVVQYVQISTQHIVKNSVCMQTQMHVMEAQINT